MLLTKNSIVDVLTGYKIVINNTTEEKFEQLAQETEYFSKQQKISNIQLYLNFEV